MALYSLTLGVFTKISTGDRTERTPGNALMLKIRSMVSRRHERLDHTVPLIIEVFDEKSHRKREADLDEMYTLSGSGGQPPLFRKYGNLFVENPVRE